MGTSVAPVKGHSPYLRELGPHAHASVRGARSSHSAGVRLNITDPALSGGRGKHQGLCDD